MIDNEYFNLEFIIENFKNNIFLETSLFSLTFNDFKNNLIDIVSKLQQINIKKKNKLGLYSENSPLHIYFMFASWLMDFYFVPLNFKTPINKLLNDIDLDYIFLDKNKYIKHNGNDNKFIDINNFYEIDSSTETYCFSPIKLSQESSIIFTSGSTGKPKGVVHTVGNYIYSSIGTIEFLEIDNKDKWLLSLPLFHVGGLLIFIRTFLSGSKCIMPNNIKNIQQCILNYKPSLISLVPTQLIRFFESVETLNVLKSCKAIILGGDKVPKWVIDKSIDMQLPIVTSYGLTESCAMVTGVRKKSYNFEYYTSGKSLPFRDVIIDEYNRIKIGGKTLLAYYIVNKKKEYPIKNGYFTTADIGEIDENGNLIVLGRADNTFISGGENIDPYEIENFITNIENIITAIVIPLPDKEYGMVPWAFIECSKPIDKTFIFNELKKYLPNYKLPKNIIFLNEKLKVNDIKYSRKNIAEKIILEFPNFFS